MVRGRPREFDTEQAMDVAMSLFWRRGYEGTSVAALAEAIGVNVPSLYAAFGNKEALFTQVVDRYIQKPASYLGIALQEPTARAVAEKAFRGAIDMVMQPGAADGCLLVHGALAAGPNAESIRQSLARRRAGAEEAVRKRFEFAKQSGDLAEDADPAQLAGFLMTMIWGLSVQAAGGAGRERLENAARLAMRCWPG